MANKNKHWSEYLPEAGTISIESIIVKHTIQKIAELEENLIWFKDFLQKEEKKLTDFALANWTQEEIDLAKSKAK